MSQTNATLQAILQELLETTDSSRTTLRIDIPERGIHVDSALAEAAKPDIRSIKIDSSLDQRRLNTVVFLEERRCNLIQEDCIASEIAPPPELIQVYGVKAQMLGPLIKDDQLIGWISVHYTPSVRKWTDKDIEALEAAKEKAMSFLQQIEWI